MSDFLVASLQGKTTKGSISEITLKEAWRNKIKSEIDNYFLVRQTKCNTVVRNIIALGFTLLFQSNYLLSKKTLFRILSVPFSFLILAVKMLIVFFFVIFVVRLSGLPKLSFIPNIHFLFPEFRSASDSKWSFLLGTLHIFRIVKYSCNNRVPILESYHEVQHSYFSLSRS